MQTRYLISRSMGSVELATRDVEDPGPGEVVVQHRMTAMSPGTERASMLGKVFGGGKWPQHPGYSGVGDVLAVGEGVNLEVGDRVLTMQDHASIIKDTIDRVFLVEDDAVADEDAAFHRLLQITLQGVRKARIEIGETVLIVGAGLIGSLAAQYAYAAGAGRVLVADPDPVRRAMVEPIAGLQAIDLDVLEPLDVTSADGRERITNDPPGGPAVVIECTGFPEPITMAFALAGHLARVVLLGSPRGNTDDVNFYRDVHKKGLTIIGAHDAIRMPNVRDLRFNDGGQAAIAELVRRSDPTVEAVPVLWSTRRDVEAAMLMVASGRVSLSPLITHRVMPDDFEVVYDLLFSSDPSLVGCLFDWSDG